MRKCPLQMITNEPSTAISALFHKEPPLLERTESETVAGKMKTLLFYTFFCLVACSGQDLDLGPLNTDCDVSATAMNDKVPGVDIPRSCFTFRGKTRCYYTYIPECASEQTPMVIDMHPYLACPSAYSAYSKWIETATRECFVIVWPIGNTDPDEVPGICWAVPAGNTGVDISEPDKETNSCCCVDFGAEDPLNPLDTEEIGDLEFVREVGTLVVDEVATKTFNQVTIDTKRIYTTGHSNGCYASIGMAMRHSDFVAASACMAGLWITPPDVDYSPVPIWTVLGSRDIVVPASGFDIFGAYVPSYDVAYNNLKALNNCTGQQVESLRIPDMDLLISRGGLQTRRATGCDKRATVEFLELSTAGHIPFQGAQEFFPAPPLAAATTVDTTRLAWNFLSSFSRSNQPPEFQETPSPTTAPRQPPTLPPAILPQPRPTSSPQEPPTLPPILFASPTNVPTDEPTRRPTAGPTDRPTDRPSTRPTPIPTARPTEEPSRRPTTRPTGAPTDRPTARPTNRPTPGPTSPPTQRPTRRPTPEPTSFPTQSPVESPTPKPSPLPSPSPSLQPTPEPTLVPTGAPTDVVGGMETLAPSSLEALPTSNPTSSTTTSDQDGLSEERFFGEANASSSDGVRLVGVLDAVSGLMMALVVTYFFLSC